MMRCYHVAKPIADHECLGRMAHEKGPAWKPGLISGSSSLKSKQLDKAIHPASRQNYPEESGRDCVDCPGADRSAGDSCCLIDKIVEQ